MHMKEDYLKELGHLGLIARLKRLSDSMLYSIRDLYKLKDFDIEPNWHLVFLILKKHERRTMTQISDSLGLSQPAVVKIINKMKKKGYVEAAGDARDNRKKQLQLSRKAIEELPAFEEVWKAGQATIEGLLKDNETFTSQLENLEDLIEYRNFRDRVLDKLSQKKR